MKVSKNVNLKLTDFHFNSPRPEYEKGDKSMTEIYAQL